jgi:phosphopantothenate---cysteine ligase (CTP)
MPLKDRKIIVTGGPTREWIDPVRYISNASSGKMGIALAEAAFHKSKKTLFIHGPIENNLLANKKFKSIQVETTADLLNAVVKELTSECILIMAAAPADFQPVEKSQTKIKKEDGTNELLLRLKKNPDILKTIAEKKSGDASLKGVFVTGFAAETDNTENNALKKLASKNLDMICLNDVSQKDAGFGTDTNRIIIYVKEQSGVKKTELPLLSKAEAAERILDLIEKELILQRRCKAASL